MEKEEGKEKSAFWIWPDPVKADEGATFISESSRRDEEMQEGKESELKKNSEGARKEYFEIRSASKEDACGYTRIPLPLILAYPTLRDEFKLTYFVLLSYAFGKNLCWPSSDTLARDTGCGVSTVYRHLAVLEGAGLVRQESVYETNPFVSRGDYIKTNKHLLELDPVEIERAIFVLEQLRKPASGRRGVLFVYKSRHKRSGFIMPNNVLLRGYRSLTAASKITFLFLCYLADENISVNFTVIASALGKERRTIERHMKELILAGLLSKEAADYQLGCKVSRGDILVRYFIEDFAEEEVDRYLREYNPQYLVCDTCENRPVEKTTDCDISENSPVDNPDIVCDTCENDSLSATQMRMDLRHEWEHKNIRIEEERYNVLLKDLHESDTSAETLPENESANLAFIISEALNDQKSLRWYYKVASSFLEHCGSHREVEKLLSETRYKISKGTLRKSPGAYFTGTIKKIAKEKGIEL